MVFQPPDTFCTGIFGEGFGEVTESIEDVFGKSKVRGDGGVDEEETKCGKEVREVFLGKFEVEDCRLVYA